MYAESDGHFAPELRLADVLIEGIDGTAVIAGTGGSYFATKDIEPVPHKYGPIMFQQVINTKTVCGGTLTLGPDGTAYAIGLASRNWGNVSMDISGVRS
jgi:hypothetical protein